MSERIGGHVTDPTARALSEGLRPVLLSRIFESEMTAAAWFVPGLTNISARECS
jgi:hypothetical protein